MTVILKWKENLLSAYLIVHLQSLKINSITLELILVFLYTNIKINSNILDLIMVKVINYHFHVINLLIFFK